jgi:DNA-binding response OmpR family regulator
MARLFIQENEQDIIDILCIALEMEGYETFTVLGYEVDFIGLIGGFRPHLVMLDYRLDGRDCIRIAKLIRSGFPLLPLLASSCNNSLQENYREQGFDGCITKPFDLEHLYLTLRTLIAN